VIGAVVALVAAPLFAAAPASAVTAPVATIDSAVTKTAATGDILLAWQMVPGATAYDIEIADSAAFNASTVVTQRTTALRWFVTTPLWGGTGSRPLYWRVTPVGVGATPDAAHIYSFTRAAAPVPTPLTPAAGATISYPAPVTFSWTPVPGASSYTVSYGPVGGTMVTTSDIVSTTFTPTTALAQKAYSWTVQAFFPKPDLRSSTSGAASASRQFTVTWAGSAPILQAPADETVVNDLEFSWTDVPGAAKYSVEIARDPSFTADTIVLTSEVSGTTFVPTDVLPSTTYYWRVTPFSVVGEPGQTSAPLQVRKIMSDVDESVPPAGTNTFQPSFTNIGTDVFSPTVLDFDQFELTWTPVPRATYYRVQVNRNGKSLLTCNTASTSATIVTDSTLSGNSTSSLSESRACLSGLADSAIAAGNNDIYIATVQAVNMNTAGTSYNNSTPSDSNVVPTTKSVEHYFKVVAGSLPTSSSPAIQTVPVASPTTDVSPTLAWTPVTGAKGYIVTLYADASASTQIGTIYTPEPRVRSTGVFVPNRTTASEDAYVAEIRPVLDTSASPSQWQYMVGYKGTISWRRSSAIPAAGTTSPGGGVPVLKMTPTPRTALGGANRGYAVTIYSKGSQTPFANLLVDQPFTVAAKAVATSSKTFTATALPTGQYEFTWSIVDSAGNAGAMSPRTGFSIGSSSATDLTAVPGPNNTSENLTWNNANAALSYTVSVTPAGSTTTNYTTNARGLTLTGLAPGQSYSWTVTSQDKDRNTSVASAPATFVVPQSTLTYTSATVTAAPVSSATIAWAAVPGASRYVVRVADAARGLSSVTGVETSALSYVPSTDLRYGTSYIFDVSAVPEWLSAASYHLYTAIPAASGRLTVITAPGLVTGMNVVVNGQSLTTSWITPAGADRGSSQSPGYTLRYRIARSDGLENAWSTVLVGSATTKTVGSLKPATAYEVQVAAGNSVGQGPWTPSARATTADTTPGAPTMTSLTRGDGSATAKWTAPASGTKPISGYNVYMRTYANSVWSAWTLAGYPDSSARSFKITSLTNGKHYEVRVAAWSVAGVGTPSASRLVVPAGKPLAPTSVKVSTTRAKSKVTWKKSATNGSAITSYKVQTSTNGSTWTTVKTTTATATSYTWTKGKKGKKYYARVIAYNSVGASPASPKVAFTAK